ncbi:MAG: hydroxymethylbilane synthase [Nitrospina sp.]|jgi:hydroxymethylbilane synthase|nr:hydroxymethylbilane synthase [Nitrospina sp.]MBT3415159.1 hydroxymethylbilane synthase [Nitrospina sp.]MBT3856617.1 hydroxymethylbilane synthase [Nitrospina sp.]MBT4103570.1 hydroxymethylbilane synthase [Nitrospina sp.]MBT4388723.1 hydroxymethylbilane synthase [Nitrospina sp.]
MESRKIKIGSRGSPLALWQANWIKDQLESQNPDIPVEIVIIKTSGDKIQDVPLAKIGGKGLFVKEIEEALLRKDVDFAVHSMKDMPIKFPFALCIACVTKRENPFDALISKDNIKLDDLPKGAKVGTGSLRRISQLLHYRPDLNLVPLRGNLETRIKKLETEGLDAIILAAAGLIRLGWGDKISEIISPEILLPAMGQGAVGIETRKHDVDNQILLADMDDENTHLALDAERAIVTQLEGGCNVPIGAFATIEGDEMTVRGLVASLDGKTVYKKELKGDKLNAVTLGNEMGSMLLDMGGDKIMQEIHST